MNKIQQKILPAIVVSVIIGIMVVLVFIFVSDQME